MSDMAEIFDELGQEVLPEIAVDVFPDLMMIREEAPTTDSGGRRVRGAVTDAYEDVPVTYEPMTFSVSRQTIGDRQVSTQQYLVTFPTHHQNERIDINPAVHRLTVYARGNEPEKTFRIVNVRDYSGVVFEVVAEKEN